MLEVKHWADHRLETILLITGNDFPTLPVDIGTNHRQEEPVARINSGRSKLEMTATFTKTFFPTLSAVAI